MARTCFEVSTLVIIFCCTSDQNEKQIFVSEKMNTYMKKYASNTGYKISSCICKGYDTDVKLVIELSQSISLITMTNILSHMFGDNIASMSYFPSEKQIDLEILG